MSHFALLENSASSTETVVGLATFLEERWLAAYLPAAERYCVEELGAVHIDEVLEDLEDFAAALKLKKAEVKRLHGEPRQPLAPAARAQPPVAPVEKPAAPVEEKPVAPVRPPPPTSTPPPAGPPPSTKKAWADITESDSEDEASTTPEVSDAASTAQSSSATADGFSMVATKQKKKAVTFSDTASTCMSEASTVPTRPAGALLVKSTLTLHESDVGALLRKNAIAIKRIEATTGAMVSVQKKEQRKSEAVPILLQGASKECVDRARELLKLHLLEEDAEKQAAKPDETVQTMEVSSRDAGVLLGSGGETVSRIQSKTNARISVSKEGAARTVTLRGPAMAVALAKEHIAAALRFVERTVEVPASAVGEIFGKGGSALQKLQKDTGARVEVPKEGEVRLVKIRARTEAEVQAAVKAIAKILMPEEHTIEDVTSEEAGVLIGKNGETIKEIQKYSGARVTISSSGPLRTVHISAPTIEKIDKAINAMKQVLKEDLPSAARAPVKAAHAQTKRGLPTLNWR